MTRITKEEVHELIQAGCVDNVKWRTMEDHEKTKWSGWRNPQDILNWLSRSTIVDGESHKSCKIGYHEGDIRIFFKYPDLSGLCIHLKEDGTWNITVGQ